MSRHKNIKTKKGFTIIEVVLVLAIAGLIFLMVFIAFPALQRGQRDTQRRDDMARFASQLAQYQSNNYSKVPGEGKSGSDAVKEWNDNFIAKYLRTSTDVFADPSGENYTVASVTVCADGKGNCKNLSGSGERTVGKDDKGADVKISNDDTAEALIRVYTNATCNGENPVYKKGNKYIAFTYKLEGAGIYCGHN
ncbi:type II secretion system protein [Candidatus Saccharibacteria bacterium]|nr:type II secretion system protein [Candidatus Saccharibacteria bacterium]